MQSFNLKDGMISSKVKYFELTSRITISLLNGMKVNCELKHECFISLGVHFLHIFLMLVKLVETFDVCTNINEDNIIILLYAGDMVFLTSCSEKYNVVHLRPTCIEEILFRISNEGIFQQENWILIK